MAASPASGVDALTGVGLAEALKGAQVVVDVSNPPSFEDAAVLKFFETSSRNLLAAEVAAGVSQEKLIKAATVTYTIRRATQFFEFIGRIADESTEVNTVRSPRPAAYLFLVFLRLALWSTLFVSEFVN